MNLSKRNSRIRVKHLAIGQVWQTRRAELHVKDLGKLLVHYKLFSGKAKKPATVVSAISAVEDYLSQNKATLISGDSAPAVGN